MTSIKPYLQSNAGRWLAAGAVAATILTGCGDGSTDEDLARQQARVHLLAHEVVALPGVDCAESRLQDQGTPRIPLGYYWFEVTPEPGLSQQQQRDLIRDVAERIWRSDLVIQSLTLQTPNAVVTAKEALGARFRDVTYAELEAALGPRPPAPAATASPVDPGNPVC